MYNRRFNPFTQVALGMAFGLPETRHFPRRRKGSIGSFKNVPRRPNPKYPHAHQGAKECARRVRQMQRLAA